MAVAAIVRALVLFVAFVSGASVGTTSVPAAGYSYDASVNSRVEAQTRGLSDASVSPVDGTCDGFGSRSPAARACATTPASASVATNTADDFRQLGWRVRGRRDSSTRNSAGLREHLSEDRASDADERLDAGPRNPVRRTG